MMRKTFQILFILPAMIPLILLILVPAFDTLYMSFHRVTYGLKDIFVGLSNFANIFTSQVFWRSLLHTVFFSFVVLVIEILLSLGVSLLVNTSFPFKNIIISIIMMPYAVSIVVAVIIFQYMFSTDAGIINYFILNVVNGASKIPWLTNKHTIWSVIVMIQIWISYPFSFLLIYSSLIGVPSEIIEASVIDGASKFQTFQRVVLPTIAPAVMLAVSFRLIFAFREFATVWILTKGGPANATELLSTLLYKQAFQFQEFGLASATSIVMLLITMVLSIPYFYSTIKNALK